MRSAVVLTGVNPHIELIEKLKTRGYQTVLIDSLENPPAKSYADIFINENAFDEDIVYRIAKDYSASLVIATNQAVANAVASAVAEKLGIKPPYPSDIAKMIERKIEMKERLTAFGVPTARFKVIDQLDNVSSIDLTYPCVVKGSVSYGSKGVFRVNDEQELREAAKRAYETSLDGRALVEEFCEGAEITAYCFVANGIARIIFSNHRFVNDKNGESIMQGYGMVYPAGYSPRIEKNLQDVANGIVEAFGLVNTPMMIQAMVNGENINVLEFALRMGGGGSVRHIEACTGFDMMSACIDAFEGKVPILDWNSPVGYSSTNNFYASRAGIIDCYKGLDYVVNSGLADGIALHRRVGDTTRATASSGGRMLTLYISASTIENLLKNIEESVSSIDAFDADGNSLMDKTLYIKDYDRWASYLR